MFANWLSMTWIGRAAPHTFDYISKASRFVWHNSHIKATTIFIWAGWLVLSALYLLKSANQCAILGISDHLFSVLSQWTTSDPHICDKCTFCTVSYRHNRFSYTETWYTKSGNKIPAPSHVLGRQKKGREWVKVHWSGKWYMWVVAYLSSAYHFGLGPRAWVCITTAYDLLTFLFTNSRRGPVPQLCDGASQDIRSSIQIILIGLGGPYRQIEIETAMSNLLQGKVRRWEFWWF